MIVKISRIYVCSSTERARVDAAVEAMMVMTLLVTLWPGVKAAVR